jgi:hypothetical protein
MMPVPTGEAGSANETFGFRYLTREAMTKLRGDIRTERKAKWELFQSHAGLIISLTVSLTGVLGAVIGVLSFMKAAPPLR